MKKLLVILIALLFGIRSSAEEGMWIPMLLEQTSIKRMQDLGLKLTAEDIYSINHSSLKDAIVQFGGGCTAEIVSSRGLIFTNHHCGLGAIQRLSSLENDYLNNGFWAKSMQQELPCQGTSVTLLVRMEDVTAQVLKGVTDEMNQLVRGQIIRQNIESIEKESVNGTHYEARIRPFYYGNQYYLFVNEVFRDIRLVGAPPNSIGQFGGDTDNWMWPRHTGDFSVFRIYANAENKPAPYSAENVPYTPKKYLPVSLKGYEKEDFTFVFGYPGTTREYLTSYGVDFTANKENPVRIGLRQLRLDIMRAAMAESRQVRIQYSAKANGVANFWKKMIGESRGIRKADAVSVKRDRERSFAGWCSTDPAREKKYGQVVRQLQDIYKNDYPAYMSNVYITEAAFGIEIIRFAAGFRELVNAGTAKEMNQDVFNKALLSVKRSATDFYKDWNRNIDQKIATIMLERLYDSLPAPYRLNTLEKEADNYKGDFDAYVRNLFAKSVFTDSAAMFRLLGRIKPSSVKTLEKDPLFRLANGINSEWEVRIRPETVKFTNRIDSLQRIFMAGWMEMKSGSPVYPDANGTLRIAYGKVDDYRPADAVQYCHFTTLQGVIQKEDTAVYDYKVDPRLKTLYYNNDYGRYADRDGTMHVAFTASNHTTGGNSGSPVLNARGELIGINFDRNWEGTLSDLYYDPTQCRNIALDIRYCLFVIDHLYGNRHIVDELELIN
jgi:hypothetical protein